MGVISLSHWAIRSGGSPPMPASQRDLRPESIPGTTLRFPRHTVGSPHASAPGLRRRAHPDGFRRRRPGGARAGGYAARRQRGASPRDRAHRYRHEHIAAPSRAPNRQTIQYPTQHTDTSKTSSDSFAVIPQIKQPGPEHLTIFEESDGSIARPDKGRAVPTKW